MIRRIRFLEKVSAMVACFNVSHERRFEQQLIGPLSLHEVPIVNMLPPGRRSVYSRSEATASKMEEQPQRDRCVGIVMRKGVHMELLKMLLMLSVRPVAFICQSLVCNVPSKGPMLTNQFVVASASLSYGEFLQSQWV